MAFPAHAILFRHPHADTGFSLIELLVALAILAVVAAIIVPRFLNIRSQAQATVTQQQLSEINNATALWQSLGGTYETNDPYAAFHLLQFLNAPGDGIHADRQLAWNLDPNTNQPYVQDSLGLGGSSTVSIITPVQGDTTSGTKLNQASQSDGYYAVKPAGTGVIFPSVPSDSHLYDKVGNQVIPVDFELASAVFIRTGSVVPPGTTEVGYQDANGNVVEGPGNLATPGTLP